MGFIPRRFRLWMVARGVVGWRYPSNMRSNVLGGREKVFAALDRLDAEAEALGQLSFDALSELDCVSVMCRLMKTARKVPAWHYELVNQLVERAVAADI